MSEIRDLIPGITWPKDGNDFELEGHMVTDAVLVVRTVDAEGREFLYSLKSEAASSLTITGMLHNVLNGRPE